MVILYKDPKGEMIFNQTTHSQSQLTNQIVADEQIIELEKHCREIEQRLGKHEVSSATHM